MPRPVGSVKTPSYRHHRASGQAAVNIGGRDHYLGPWKSKASLAEYDRLVGEWLAAGRRAPVAASDLSIVELIAAYWKFASEHHASATGNTGQLDNIKSMLKLLKERYGHTRAVDFGPLALHAVRDAMIAKGWSRNHVNAQTTRLRRLFRWAVAHELLPESVHRALTAVEGLRYGKSAARETEPVKPVPAPFVDAVLPYLSSHVKTMVELQGVTGMRSGELVLMRGADLDTTGELWKYAPAQHKGKHRGHDRTVYLGGKAQELVRPFLKLDPGAYLFSPAEAEADRRAAIHSKRKTLRSCGNRPGTNRKRKPDKSPGERYTTSSYRRSIADACRKAFPPAAELTAGLDDAAAKVKLREWRRAHAFHPHQLRHSHATKVRELFGLEGAQAALGQRTVAATQIYAERSDAAARNIAAKIG